MKYLYPIILFVLSTLLQSCFKDNSISYPYDHYPNVIHASTTVDSFSSKYARVSVSLVPFIFDASSEKFLPYLDFDSLVVSPGNNYTVKPLGITNNTSPLPPTNLSLMVLFDYSAGSGKYYDQLTPPILHLYQQLGANQEVAIAINSGTQDSTLNIVGDGFYSSYAEKQIDEFVSSAPLLGGGENLIKGIDSALTYLAQQGKHSNKQLLIISNKPYLLTSYTVVNALVQKANSLGVTINFKNVGYATNINNWFFEVNKLASATGGLYTTSDADELLGHSLSLLRPDRQTVTATFEIIRAQSYYNSGYYYANGLDIYYKAYNTHELEDFVRFVFEIP
ncbi:MAG: hypothetical protein JNK66_05530 [Chitinophagales bacterium]|nr:hypothetical protein [Chitinophagales bacterium]